MAGLRSTFEIKVSLPFLIGPENTSIPGTTVPHNKLRQRFISDAPCQSRPLTTYRVPAISSQPKRLLATTTGRRASTHVISFLETALCHHYSTNTLTTSLSLTMFTSSSSRAAIISPRSSRFILRMSRFMPFSSKASSFYWLASPVFSSGPQDMSLRKSLGGLPYAVRLLPSGH